MSPARVEEAPIRCAVLDLGSTSFQLLVTDAEADGTLTHVLRDRVILNLGADVAATVASPRRCSTGPRDRVPVPRRGRTLRRGTDPAGRDRRVP